MIFYTSIIGENIMKSVLKLISKKVATTSKVAVFYTHTHTHTHTHTLTNPAKKFFYKTLKVLHSFEVFAF